MRSIIYAIAGLILGLTAANAQEQALVLEQESIVDVYVSPESNDTNVKLSSEAQAKVQALTSENIGQRMIFKVNGKEISRPVIRDAMTGDSLMFAMDGLTNVETISLQVVVNE